MRRRLGSGAFATVWLAYDEHLDSPVAVKVLADNRTDDAQVRRRFLEEGRYLRRVESPHVVPVYDAGELPDGRPYLVMAYADQGTLAARYDPSQPGGGTPPTPGQALAVLRQVGSGLQALHDRGVLHRDVKPSNVLMEGRTPVLIDFGLAKLATKNLPGALLVGGGAVVKSLYDRRRSRLAQRREGDRDLIEQAHRDD